MSTPKAQSLRALDLLNFCNAGIQTGLGPFIAIFYGATRHWSPGRIGVLLACQSLAGVTTQAWIGSRIDETHYKRFVTAIAAIAVACGALGIALSPSFALQVVVQLVIGLGVSVFPAATTAFALGLVGQDQMARRLARNESFTHAGNVTFAVVAGIVGTVLALAGIFYAAAIFAAGMAGAVLLVREEADVNYEAARAGGDGHQPRARLRDLFGDGRIRIFVIAVVLFNLSNAATLSLVSQLFAARQHGHSASWQTAAAVFVAEAVMVGVAVFAGRKATSWGRKPLFVMAFGVLAVRNLLGVVSHDPYFLIGLQTLDGVAAATYGVLLKVVAADLADGTGRFNLLQGSIQSAMGTGAFLSNLGFGALASARGFNASFVGLSVVAVGGGLLYLVKMPETRRDSA